MLQQHAHMGPHGEIDETVIAAPRHDQSHIDAAHCRKGQCRDNPIVGQKIGRHHADRHRGAADDLQQHQLDLLEILVGARRNHARHAVASGHDVREPGCAFKVLADRESPVAPERGHQLRHHRTGEAEVRVRHRPERLGGQ